MVCSFTCLHHFIFAGSNMRRQRNAPVSSLANVVRFAHLLSKILNATMRKAVCEITENFSARANRKPAGSPKMPIVNESTKLHVVGGANIEATVACVFSLTASR